MLFQTPSQFVVLLLLLVIGWLFGLASHPGGRKWRDAYNSERTGNAGYRDESEAQLKANDQRIATLESENAQLRADLDRARAAPTVAPVAAAAAVAAIPAATPAPEADPKRGWFSWGDKDDFSRIRGLDNTSARKLREEGVTRFADLASLNGTDELALERRIGLPAGSIQREQWREQAALLADNKADEHKTRFS